MGFVKVAVVLALTAVLVYRFFPTEAPLAQDALVGKRVVVTGASSGIGEQLAYHYCRLGANVVITARREDRLKQVTKKCRVLSPGGRVQYYVADMGKAGQAKTFLKKAVTFLGGLDQLQINHGLLLPAREFSFNPDDLDVTRKVMEVNFHSYVELVWRALPELEKTRGSIGVVSSITGKMPSARALPYSASKHALTGFFQGLEEELRVTGRNVTVTVHILGLIDTEGLQNVVTSYPGLETETSAYAESATDTALAVITATTRRHQLLYYPKSAYFLSLLYHVSPMWTERLMAYRRGQPERKIRERSV